MNRRESTISYDEASRTWLLSMASSSYALGADADGSGLHHLYWGRLLSHANVRQVPLPAEPIRNADKMTWGGNDPLEYSAFGGRSYDEPTLKVDFPDGTRGIEWNVGEHRIESGSHGSTTLAIELVDLRYPFVVVVCYRVFDGSDVIERWSRIENRGDEGTIVVRQAYSADWWLPASPTWRLRYLHGGWAHETQLVETTLTPGKMVLESRRGTTSHHFNPWFSLDAGGKSTEELGEVFTGALAWSGTWKFVIEQTPSGRHHVCGGWNEFDAPLELAAGVTLGLPVFAGCYSSEGFGGASRAWHAYQRDHVLTHEVRNGGSPSFPTASVRRDGPLEVRPVLYNSWEATTFSVDEKSQGTLAEIAAGIGAELFVVDDGWFIGRNDDHAGLGDWTVDEAKFPRGLAPLIDKVHGLGMGFGIWVEPEMVNPNSNLYREHPDWVYHFPHRARTEARNQLILNFAREDVREWIFATLDALLSDHAIDFVKWDMNRNFSEPGWPDAPGGNPERIWTEHVRNLYDILERLRRAHPGVAFESCSGGGGRIDLGILSRTEEVWTSDNTDGFDRIAIQEGFSQIYAPIAMMAWVTDSPNPLTRRRLPLRYRFHVAMAGSLGLGGDLVEWSADELAEATELVATYKSIRHLVQLGELHRLASTRDGAVGAVLYLEASGTELVVLAWWGVRNWGPLPGRLRLTGLNAAARYRDAVSGEERLGGDLMAFGVDLADELDFGSCLIHLVRQDDWRQPLEG